MDKISEYDVESRAWGSEHRTKGARPVLQAADLGEIPTTYFWFPPPQSHQKVTLSMKQGSVLSNTEPPPPKKKVCLDRQDKNQLTLFTCEVRRNRGPNAELSKPRCLLGMDGWMDGKDRDPSLGVGQSSTHPHPVPPTTSASAHHICIHPPTFASTYPHPPSSISIRLHLPTSTSR